MRLVYIAAACAALLHGAAAAEVYPARPITMIVPFAAGGPADALARLLSEPLRRSLGEPVIVETVTGASGAIAVGRVVRAAPDGYTIGIGHWSTHVLNGAFFSLPYDLLTDLEPITLLPANPALIIVRKGLPANDVNELIAWLKANPD